jgi:hypothetical protein
MRASTKAIALLVMLTAAACGGGDDDDDGDDEGDDDDGGGGGFVISGRVPGAGSARLLGPARAAGNVTHVMAVNAESANPERALAAVQDDGSFELDIPPGSPYVLVFVDASQVGAEMIQGVFRAETLDTIVPTAEGEAELGDVAIDGEGTASTGVPYDELLALYGLDAETAALVGAIDDLSLRYANPDIDGNGVLDIEEDHRFALDFHIRAAMQREGVNLRVDDLVGGFLPTEGAAIASPLFNLASIYAMYPASFDETDYVVSSGVSTDLMNGGGFAAVHDDASPPSEPTSFSGSPFGDTRSWGPDYDLTIDGVELPGSGGSAATLTYTLGGPGVDLSYPMVKTRTRASLTAEGVLTPFIKLNVDGGGAIASVDYQWMKRGESGWTLATQQEIDVVVGSGGGYVAVHRVPDYADQIGFTLDRTPTGTVTWDVASVHLDGVSEADFLATTPDDICALAVSYDDKLGLRLFAGGVDANEGVTCGP